MQSFSVEFLAKEDVVLDVLNRFSRDDLFIVVTGVEFTKGAQDLNMPSSGETKVVTGDKVADSSVTKSVKSEPPVRQQRRVSGPSIDMPMVVRVDLDVYTFFVHKVKALKETSD